MTLKFRSAVVALIASAALWGSEPCFATTIVDPSGDILSTYVGPVGADLDILQFTVTSDANNFYFQVLLGGAPGTTALTNYLVGVDRGAGTNTFPVGFRPGASQDAVISFRPTLTGQVQLFQGGVPVTTTPLASGAVSISGNTISAAVPIVMLPSTGFASEDYTFLLWSRTPNASAPQLGIADFAPDQGLLSLVPEPSTWLMMLLGFGTIGFVIRRAARPVDSPSNDAPAERENGGRPPNSVFAMSTTLCRQSDKVS